MALILERRLTKDEILELYLNEVYLGQRGSFAIHGVAEASRLYLRQGCHQPVAGRGGDDCGPDPDARRSTRRSATPSARRNAGTWSCARWPTAGYITTDAAAASQRAAGDRGDARWTPKPRTSSTRSCQSLAEEFPGLATGRRPRRLHDPRPAPAASSRRTPCAKGCRGGPDAGEKQRGRGRRRPHCWRVDPAHRRRPRLRRRTSLQPVAVQPRRPAARRQPGSVFKPFVYLAAFEQAAAEGRTDLTPATMVDDSPTTFTLRRRGMDAAATTATSTTARSRCAARSRCHATSPPSRWPKWWATARSPRSGARSAPARSRAPIPSIALGVFEATPWEIAQAYTVFPNRGELRPLHTLIARDRRRARRRSRCRRADAPEAHRPGRHDLPRH